MIKIGEANLDKIMIGETAVSKVFRGEQLVWESGALPSGYVKLEYL